MRLLPSGGKSGKERPFYFLAFFVQRSKETSRKQEAERRCCGLDIHKDSIEVWVLAPVGKEGKGLSKRYRTFRNDLIRLRVWLKQLNVTEIAMESTGVYFALSSALIGRVEVPPALG